MPPKASALKAANHREETDDSSNVPDNWPEDVTFLREQTYSDAVTSDMRAGLSRTTNESETWTKIPPSLLKTPNPLVAITIVSDPKHPAHGQRGLFAAQTLEPDSLICIYSGHVHTNSLSDTDPHSDYDLAYDKDLGLSIDGAKSGNDSRFANDYRGIAERANAEFRDCFVQVPSEKRAGGVKWERRVGIFVLSAGKAGKRKAGIREGEEVLINYGKSFWEARKSIAEFRNDFEMCMLACGEVCVLEGSLTACSENC